MFQENLKKKYQMCFKKISKQVSRVFQECFDEVFLTNLLLHGSHRSYPSRRRASFFLILSWRRVQTLGKHVFMLIKYITIHNWFFHRPRRCRPVAKRNIFFLFLLILLQGASIGLAKTNHALLSLVNTNLMQFTCTCTSH